MIRRKRLRRGVTLPEMMVGGSIALLIITALVSLSIAGARSWSNNGSQILADDAASIAIQRWATDVSAGSNARVVNGELQVTVPGTNGVGDYERNNATTTIRYYVQGNRLYRQQGTATAIQLADKVVDVSFSVAAPQVTLNLTVRREMADRTKTATMYTQASLRNYDL